MSSNVTFMDWISKGVLRRAVEGEQVQFPIFLQVLAVRPVSVNTDDLSRYSVCVSDGEVYHNTMLAIKNNHLVPHDLKDFTIVRINDWTLSINTGEANERRLIVLLDLAVVVPGYCVGRKVGDPVKLKLERNETSTEQAESNTGMILCIICSDSLKNNVVSTQCGHIFHQVCLEDWLKNSKTCPSCRSNTTSRDLLKLFFNYADNQEANEINKISGSSEEIAKENEELKSKLNELTTLQHKTNEEKQTLSIQLMAKEKSSKRQKNLFELQVKKLRIIERNGHEELITKINKMNTLMESLKQDLLAERHLRRIYQKQLHEFDPLNENYNTNNIHSNEHISGLQPTASDSNSDQTSNSSGDEEEPMLGQTEAIF